MHETSRPQLRTRTTAIIVVIKSGKRRARFNVPYVIINPTLLIAPGFAPRRRRALAFNPVPHQSGICKATVGAAATRRKTLLQRLVGTVRKAAARSASPRLHTPRPGRSVSNLRAGWNEHRKRHEADQNHAHERPPIAAAADGGHYRINTAAVRPFPQKTNKKCVNPTNAQRSGTYSGQLVRRP